MNESRACCVGVLAIGKVELVVINHANVRVRCPGVCGCLPHLRILTRVERYLSIPQKGLVLARDSLLRLYFT